MIFVYITNPDQKTAEKLAKKLLQKRLIACANIFPIKSIFRWEGKINKEKEFVLIAKTLAKNYLLIKKEIEKIHPYKTPCIIKIPVIFNERYKNWVKKEVV